MASKFLVILFSLFLLLGVLVVPVKAQEQCEGVYGGGQICRKGNVMIDKMVQRQDGTYVDNLGTGNSFRAGNEISFRIRVKNTGDYKIDNMYVRDTLPAYLDYVSGPSGDKLADVSYDSGSRVLSFTVKDLEKDEGRDYYFITRVVSENNLPNGSVCVINYAKTEANGRVDEDTAQVCMNKGQILGVTTLPETGPGAPQLMLLEALGLAVVGSLYLRLAKRATK